MAGYISYERLLERAKAAGLTSYKIKVQRIIGQATWSIIQKGRSGNRQHINTATIAALCEALNCQPGDILEYIPDNADGR